MILGHFCGLSDTFGGLLDTFGDLATCVLHLFCIKWAVDKGPIKKMNHHTFRVYILLIYCRISSLKHTSTGHEQAKKEP